MKLYNAARSKNKRPFYPSHKYNEWFTLQTCFAENLEGYKMPINKAFVGIIKSKCNSFHSLSLDKTTWTVHMKTQQKSSFNIIISFQQNICREMRKLCKLRTQSLMRHKQTMFCWDLHAFLNVQKNGVDILKHLFTIYIYIYIPRISKYLGLIKLFLKMWQNLLC